jgi:putative endonuclease
MSKSRRDLGIWGEKEAEKYLVKKAYTIIERNYRSPYGEIDIIAQKKGITVFVEVKTRSSLTFGWPEESISPAKELKLIQTAEEYLSKQVVHTGAWRIDVISVLRKPSGSTHIFHFENAVHEK